jgi:predicted aspartyl protease
MTRYVITADCSPDRIAQVGPLIPGSWSRHDDELGRELRGEFLIDTGAYGAMIDLDVAEALQLSSQGTREVHGIHGYGTLRQFFGRISLPALDCVGGRTLFTSVIECVGVPSLREKNRQHGVEVIGILGRMFLRCAQLRIDGSTGRIELRIDDK